MNKNRKEINKRKCTLEPTNLSGESGFVGDDLAVSLLQVGPLLHKISLHVGSRFVWVLDPVEELLVDHHNPGEIVGQLSLESFVLTFLGLEALKATLCE